jgi:hypothetical protein
MRSLLAAALLATATVVAACTPAPGGGEQSDPAEPSQAPASDAAAPAAPSETPRDNPNY